MTTPNVTDLLAAVRTLGQNVAELAGRMAIQRRVVAALIVSVVLDLALSGLFIKQHLDQSAVNSRTACANHQRQALTALTNADQDANRRFYVELLAAKGAKAGQAVAISDLFGAWDRDKTLRLQIVANKHTVRFTLPADGITFLSPASYTVEPCT